MLCTSSQLLLLGHVALGQSTFTHLRSLSPLCSDCELAGLERDVIPENTAKDHLGGGETSDRVRTVAVEKESTGHLVTVKTSIGSQVVHDHAFSTFNRHLGSLITSWIVI